MNYMFKNGVSSCVDLASVLHEISDFETVAERLLARVDIVAAINYYGITELLDTIGEESLRVHLENLKTDRRIRSKIIISK